MVTCTKTFRHEENLKKHKELHNEEQLVQTVLQKDSLKDNDGAHTLKKLSTCITCDKTFKNDDEMKQHEKLHTEEKPVDKISLQSDSLKNIKNHTPVKS